MGDPIVRLHDEIDRLRTALAQAERQRDEARGLLREAKCPDPNCDGNGTTIHRVTRTDAGCCGQFLESGECCGNAAPVPVEDIEPEPCRWCHERDAHLRDMGE